MQQESDTTASGSVPAADGVDVARLQQILGFMRLTDTLKAVERSVEISGRSRKESAAEHSWHLALFCCLMSERDLPPSLDRLRLLELALVHDLVEVYAGDTPLYSTLSSAPGAAGGVQVDASKRRAKQERERAAADRLFSQLPPDLASRMRGLWEEFEAQATAEAAAAKGLDKLHALVQNSCSEGSDYLTCMPPATLAGEESLLAPYVAAAPALAALGRLLLTDAHAKGWLTPPASPWEQWPAAWQEAYLARQEMTRTFMQVVGRSAPPELPQASAAAAVPAALTLEVAVSLAPAGKEQLDGVLRGVAVQLGLAVLQGEEEVEAAGWPPAVLLVPLKQYAHAAEKAAAAAAAAHAGGGMKDIVRGSVLCADSAQLSAAALALQRLCCIVGVREHWVRPTATGFRDVALQLLLPAGCCGEVQLVLAAVKARARQLQLHARLYVALRAGGDAAVGAARAAFEAREAMEGGEGREGREAGEARQGGDPS